jgi:hypothetical protein
MKKIERPDSTTVVIETMFHLVKDKAELANILKGLDVDKQVKNCGTIVDPEMLQPISYIWIDEGKSFFESLKYAIPMEYTVE